MKISRLSIKNFLGINETELDLKKINYVKGPKGSGKTSILEAIEKVFTNKNRRTELVKHGETESCLYVKTDDGLEIDRKLRTDKADYLKVKKNEAAAPSTETFLRSMIQGQIFRPLDWINLSIQDQTKSILAMLEIDWTMKQIQGWFGEIPSNIDYEMHILQILRSIESKYFKEREAINREVKELEIQVKGMMDELPAGYDGDSWREKKLQDYYEKVTEAQKINHWIEEAKTLKENYESKVASIKTSAEGEKSRIKLKYNEQRHDIKDIIELSKGRIDKAKEFMSNSNRELEIRLQEIKNNNEKSKNQEVEAYNLSLKNLEEEYRKKKESLGNLHNAQLKSLSESLTNETEQSKKDLQLQIDEQKDLISINESKIAAKEQEFNSLGSLEEQEYITVDERVKAEIEKEQTRLGKAAEYIENNEPVDLTPLQAQAEEVERMQSYIREYDRMCDIRDGRLASKKEYSATLTKKIEKARELPGELLKVAKMPIQGISVDSNGLIRINGTLITDLSDGEKLDLSLTIAKAQCGELKLICLDRFESLNPSARKSLIDQMVQDDYQYIMTSTESDDFEIVQFDTEEDVEKYFEGGQVNE